MNHNDWKPKADENGNIQLPDELEPLFNKIGFQFRFHTISGKNELQSIVDCVYIAQKFFTEHPELCKSDGTPS